MFIKFTLQFCLTYCAFVAVNSLPFDGNFYFPDQLTSIAQSSASASSSQAEVSDLHAGNTNDPGLNYRPNRLEPQIPYDDNRGSLQTAGPQPIFDENHNKPVYGSHNGASGFNNPGVLPQRIPQPIHSGPNVQLGHAGHLAPNRGFVQQPQSIPPQPITIPHHGHTGPNGGFGLPQSNLQQYIPQSNLAGPPPPSSSALGSGQAQSNAQANSQNNGNSFLSSAISNSQSLDASGGSSSGAAAASAGVTIVNGIPIASAASSASSAAASPFGSSGSSVSSAANSGGFGNGVPPQRVLPQPYPNSYSPYANNQNQFYNQQQQQQQQQQPYNPWLSIRTDEGESEGTTKVDKPNETATSVIENMKASQTSAVETTTQVVEQNSDAIFFKD